MWDDPYRIYLEFFPILSLTHNRADWLKNKLSAMIKHMVSVAQLVRAPDCGPGGRGFESHRSPHTTKPTILL